MSSFTTDPAAEPRPRVPAADYQLDVPSLADAANSGEQAARKVLASLSL